MKVDTNRSMTGWPNPLHTSCMAKRGKGPADPPKTTDPPKITEEARLAGERLRHALRIVAISRSELSRRLNMAHPSTVGNYTRGIRTLPIDVAKRIDAVTGIPAAYLMGLVDETDMEL